MSANTDCTATFAGHKLFLQKVLRAFHSALHLRLGVQGPRLGVGPDLTYFTVSEEQSCQRLEPHPVG